MSSGSPNPDQSQTGGENASVETTTPPVSNPSTEASGGTEAASGESVQTENQPLAPTPDATPTPEVAPPPKPEAASQPADEAPTPEQGESERPKVKLNPVSNPATLRAVGSVDAVEQPSVIPSGGEPPAAMPVAPTGPVEIPDVDDLDDDIAAQVEAALSDAQEEAPAAAVDAPVAETGLDEAGLPVEGTSLTGTVQSIHEDNVFLDVGLRISAVVPLRQFDADKQPSVGDTLTVSVEGPDKEESLLLTNLPRGTRKISGNWDDVAEGQTVECVVTKSNKGGLEVTISNLRGFLPASQIDLNFVEDTEVYIGQKLRVQITEVNRKKRNLVVSRRVLMQAERDAEAGAFWETINVGDTHTGTVKTLKDYGAFINIGPVDGFLHIGEISWSRVNHPRDVLTEGQTVEVKIIKLDEEKKRIGLGMRQLSQNPWLVATEKYAADRVVTGTVTRVADFGAFVQLEPGIEGLVHISELAWKRVRAVADVLSVGQTEEFKVLEIDPKRKRISLSLKQTQSKPEAAKPSPEEAQERQAPRRAPRTDLRGGTGSTGAGGLFGNPSDFT